MLGRWIMLVTGVMKRKGLEEGIKGFYDLTIIVIWPESGTCSGGEIQRA